MKIVAYEDDGGRTAIGIEPDDGVLPGANDADHLAEAGLRPREPVFFAKLRSAVIGADEPIRIPTPHTHTDWEAELCVIIGKPAYRVPAERAHEYVFGYTMINDVSARDVMDREPLQIPLCKCPDTFCPLGPHIVTVDEVTTRRACAHLARAATAARENRPIRTSGRRRRRRARNSALIKSNCRSQSRSGVGVWQR